MADSSTRQTGIDPAARSDGKSGFVVDPGPYEAIVVKHVEDTRSGQLLVYIPDWGGLQTDYKNQICVNYASPFFGKTYGTDDQNLDPNSAYTSGQTYGMWMVPPDVGCKVLVTFVAGDKGRGYWFACCYDSTTHHMVPGIARSVSTDKSDTLVPGDLTQYLRSDSVLPVSETTTGGNSEAFNPDAIDNSKRWGHPYQTMVLVGQGLDRDPIRGAISSSSLRESPSNVYGISTPGRSATASKQFSATFADSADPDQAVAIRKGGHQFVMDDGDKDGNDQLIRLRTAGGHQLLMNDKEHVLYIASDTGNQWLEFGAKGDISMYGAGGFNLRSDGPINMHSESAILMNSAGSIAINAEMGVSITSLTTASMSGLVSASVSSDGFASLSAVGAASVTGGYAVNINALGDCAISGAMIRLNSPYLPKSPIPVPPNTGNSLPDVSFNGQQWQYAPGALRSICTKVPTHEPYIDPDTGKRPDHATGKGNALTGIALSVGISAATKLFF